MALYSETSYLLDRLIESLRAKRRKEGSKVLRESQEVYIVDAVGEEPSPQTLPPP